jgi:hypothetical protein
MTRASILSIFSLAAGIAVFDGDAARHPARAQAIPLVDARVIALNIPGASAVSQVGTFLGPTAPVPPSFPFSCKLASPIPGFSVPPGLPGAFTQPGAVLDPNRILVGSRSNFGAPLITDGSREGSFLSIDPSGSGILIVPPNFAASGVQTPPSGPVQMFSANSANWYNGQNNPGANTASFTGVSNPLGLSNNNGFGRLWPANAPFGDSGIGSSTILDPDGRPLKGAPNSLIGGVYAGDKTNRDKVAMPQQPQVIPGSLNTGAVGTAFLGPSPDGSCKAVFSVVTADGAIVQEHTFKGLDGLAPAGTVQPLLGKSWDLPNQGAEPRLGMLMNPYTATPFAAWQLFVSEPFNNTIAVINLKVKDALTPGNQVFDLDSVTRISSPFLKLPVDLAPVTRDADSKTWASNTTLDATLVNSNLVHSDFYVANRGNNTIVRMRQDGSVVATVRVTIDSLPLNNFAINGIATSTDGTKIYVTFTSPTPVQGGLLELAAFGG